jgi:D-erythro-7,8-dihydroneopterin triphosphate epimerase
MPSIVTGKEAMMDKLRIRELAVRCKVGVTSAERNKPQVLLITLTLHADLSKACSSDHFKDTVDYKAVKLAILNELEKKSFRLIERVAQRVAELALHDRRVLCVEVQVQKPGALRFAKCSEVEIVRTRDNLHGGRDE